MKQAKVIFPQSYNTGAYSNSSNGKISVIKALRCLTGMGLKDAKDASESDQPLIIQYKGSAEDDENIRILRVAGCSVGGAVHIILQGLRDLASAALLQGDDELAHEILQLVFAEKLRRDTE